MAIKSEGVDENDAGAQSEQSPSSCALVPLEQKGSNLIENSNIDEPIDLSTRRSPLVPSSIERWLEQFVLYQGRLCNPTLFRAMNFRKLYRSCPVCERVIQQLDNLSQKGEITKAQWNEEKRRSLEVIRSKNIVFGLRHIHSHLKYLPFRCKLCPTKYFADIYEINRHLKDVHGVPKGAESAANIDLHEIASVKKLVISILENNGIHQAVSNVVTQMRQNKVPLIHTYCRGQKKRPRARRSKTRSRSPADVNCSRARSVSQDLVDMAYHQPHPTKVPTRRLPGRRCARKKCDQFLYFGDNDEDEDEMEEKGLDSESSELDDYETPPKSFLPLTELSAIEMRRSS